MGLVAAAAGVLAGPVLSAFGYPSLAAVAGVLLVPVVVLLIRGGDGACRRAKSLGRCRTRGVGSTLVIGGQTYRPVRCHRACGETGHGRSDPGSRSDQRFGEFTAVDAIDVDVVRGEAFGFLGPNGAGKSSTMRNDRLRVAAKRRRVDRAGMDPRRDGPRIRAGSASSRSGTPSTRS